MLMQVEPTAVTAAEADAAPAPTAAPAEEAPAPVERKQLKAGPAGGAYIPPFRLAQMMKEQQVTSALQETPTRSLCLPNMPPPRVLGSDSEVAAG